jgi:type II secretory pathway pseudopilin PulG
VAQALFSRLRLEGASPMHHRNTQRGSALIESVAAVAIFTMVGAAALAGLAATQRYGNKVEGQSLAENLARSQMEYVFSLPYLAPPATYAVLGTPPGYALSAQAIEQGAGAPDRERVVVTVSREGAPVLVLETVRTR